MGRKYIIIAGAVLYSALNIQAAPEKLLAIPLKSPDSKYSANVEWDTAGFIGRIRMLIYAEGNSPVTVELPQIKPSPANLYWITNTWVACESFVAESGAAFFYTDVPREKAYMIEIFAPEENDDWFISYTTNDSVSSETLHALSVGRSSLFPILLRNLPTDELSYLSPDFTYLLADAVDSFAEWRKQENFVEMKFLTDMVKNPSTGCLVLASTDDVAEIVYFPQGTTTTREMLALTQRKPLPDAVQMAINGVDPPTLKIEWVDDAGQFRVLGSWEDDTTTVSELVTGKFEGVADSVYSGPGVTELLTEGKSTSEADSNSKGVGEIKITDVKLKVGTKKPASKTPGNSKTKKPSRSN